MDIKEIASRIKQRREEDSAARAQAAARTVDPAETFRIRARMIGVLLRDARLKAGRTIEEAARKVQVSPEQFEGWELGDDAPTLPQLELLAYLFEVPVSHFWGVTTLQSQQTDALSFQKEYAALRDRMIGALLRKARLDRGLEIEAVAAQSDLPAERIAAFELGEIPIPMHELTVLAHVVGKNLSYFLESDSHIGEFLAMREAWKTFTELPEEVRRFASNPLNGGYIEFAMMLSQMPADRLRRMGESLLNITL
ncbi:MAG: helix-turn-helix domain-containing protein [Candidatus Flexifilum sp.]|jgi:transcriptional regulator with XRE-family HTH domain